jgi:tetratricopeptide (TPR) repeat protein
MVVNQYYGDVEMLTKAYDLMNEKKYDEASRVFGDIPRDNPQYSEALLGLARVYFRKGEFEKCKHSCEQAIKADASSPMPYVVLAHTMQRLGASQDICYQLAETAYNLAPDAGETRACLGWANLLAQKYEQAIKLLESALEIVPNNSAVYLDLFSAYTQLNRIQSAYVAARKIYSLAPSLNTGYMVFVSFMSLKLTRMVIIVMLSVSIIGAMLLPSSLLLLIPGIYVGLMLANSLYMLKTGLKQNLLWVFFFIVMLIVIYIMGFWLNTL